VAPVHVLRDSLDEVDGMNLTHCRELGLTVIDVELEVLPSLTALPRRLSRRHRLAFHVCRERDWICATTDRPLRQSRGEHGIRARRGLEPMLELVSVVVLAPSRAWRTARRIHENSPHHISEAILERFAARLDRAR